MPSELKVTIGQYSDKGRKAANQDFYGALIPQQPLLALKGISVAIADGISSSGVSRIAAETAIRSFFTDYYCTSETWSVKTSARTVIAATNAWLYSQSQSGAHSRDRDQGFVCTFSVMVLKSRTAHVFHCGDSRVYRVSGASLEQITHDHRVSVQGEGTYLGRALGADGVVEIDYHAEPIAPGDVFLLATDGVYEFASAEAITEFMATHGSDLDGAARAIVQHALVNGSEDNLTVQIVRIDTVPAGEPTEAANLVRTQRPAPHLGPRSTLDGFRIDREIHASSRSHIYLATDSENGQKLALKVPSADLGSDPDYLKRLMMEEWIARRIDNAHVLKPHASNRTRSCLYVTTEYVEGQTLRQWMIDNPRPSLEQVRSLVEQIAKGLRAFHRKEMLHQDLRPENVMIDAGGTAKIIDFGSARVAGVLEALPQATSGDILGTLQYTAPEYFLGDAGTNLSDLFSLGVIAYEMLTGALPYGPGVSRLRTRSQLARLRYVPCARLNPAVPGWLDGALHKAVELDPTRRYQSLSEFLHDLRHPNPGLAVENRPALFERNPVLAWQIVALLLLCSNAILLYLLHR